MGLYGTLTLNADGSYTYVSNDNSVSANQTDTFVYSIRDGDGDVSTTTLVINVNNANLAGDNDIVTVNEAALDTAITGSDIAAGSVTGSNPGLATETVTGQLNVAGAAANGFTAQDVTTANGRFVLNSDGSYTYTLTSPVATSPQSSGANTVLGVNVFTYAVMDVNGNSTTGHGDDRRDRRRADRAARHRHGD